MQGIAKFFIEPRPANIYVANSVLVNPIFSCQIRMNNFTSLIFKQNAFNFLNLLTSELRVSNFMMASEGLVIFWTYRIYPPDFSLIQEVLRTLFYDFKRKHLQAIFPNSSIKGILITPVVGVIGSYFMVIPTLLDIATLANIAMTIGDIGDFINANHIIISFI